MAFIDLVSPLELWKDYDPDAQELHLTPIRTIDDGMTVTKSMYFDALGTDCGGVVRAYAELKYTHEAFASSNGYLPVVLLAGDLFENGAKDCVWQMTGAGYAVLAVDLKGDESAPRCTLYPTEFAFAKYENARTSLYHVRGEARDTAWYVWTVIARRAITLVGAFPEADASRLGVLGLREGGNVAMCLASLDPRVKSAAVIGNTGWQNYGLLYDSARADQIGFFDEQAAVYNCSLSVEAYAQFVKRPVLFLIGTNDTYNDFDRAFDTFGRLPQTLKCALSVSPRADGSIRYDQLGNLQKWMDSTVLFKGEFPRTPQLEAYVSDARQYVRLTAEQPDKIRDVSIYYAYNEEDYRVRNWYEAACESVADGQWIASLEVAHEDRYVFCFAVVTYDGGASVASKQVAKKPRENGVTATKFLPSRLIYDSASGKDCFTVINTGGLFDYRNELELREGPLEIPGIQASFGELATFKLADPRYSGYEGDLISVTYYSPSSCKVEFKLGVLSGGWREYTYVLTAIGNDLWQKAALALSDFKDENGSSPKSWEEAARFGVRRERGKTFLISTLLWA